MFQALEQRFGSSQLDFSGDLETLFQLLLERRAQVNASTVDSYCADCIGLFKRLAPIDTNKACLLLDTVLILSGPNDEVQHLLDIYCKNPFKDHSSAIDDWPKYPEEFECRTVVPSLPQSASALPTVTDPSVKEFLQLRRGPFIATDVSSSWPALKKWKSPKFWITLVGHRYFPVEVGSSYLDPDWTQDFIQLKAYLDKFIFSPAPVKETAYIAQHNWIHQVPELLTDFDTPELCDLFLGEALSMPIVHFWFGMAGTLSPLHFDKYDNFFCQIVGAKRVILVSPDFSHHLSVGSNTCPLVGEQLTLLLASIAHQVVIVQPGQTLFIPKGWWHQVESLAFSISLSFWF